MEYKVIVKNTGNVTIKFGALKDTGCEGISPSGATELAAGAEETFTCTHDLINIGTYSNEASIEGNEGTGTRVSNKVTAKVSAKAAYTIEKQQRIKGESSYTSSELSGEVGQVVEYKIIVKNTGNVSITFGSLKDGACSGISPSGSTELAPGKEEAFTCTHTLTSVGTYTNEASIEGCEGIGTKTSNKVTVKVTAKPSFTIEKQQKVAGESSYTTAEKTAEVGQSMNYLIVVKNTGNIALKFSALKDSGCEGILPSGTTELAAGKEESFTCSHTLTSAGTYTNEASIEGNEGTGTKTSNKVTVKIPAKPAYTIEKLQRLAGESAYNKNELSGKFGQKVEYKIVVKNTGNVPLKFAALKDTACENISPSGATEVARTAKKRPSPANTRCRAPAPTPTKPRSKATKAPAPRPPTKSRPKSNAEPNYSIEKFQQIGAEAYSNETRNATVGQTVEYEIVVKNTGNVSLTFSGFADEHCDAGTIAGGPSGAVKPGESAIYTCSHVLTTTDESHGSFSNEASITGSEGTGTKKSNKVEVTVCPASVQKPAVRRRRPLALQRRRQPRQLEQHRRHRVRQTDQLRPAGDGRRTAAQTGHRNQGRLGLPDHRLQHRQNGTSRSPKAASSSATWRAKKAKRR